MNAAIIIGLAVLGVGAAVVAFIRTPPEFRYKHPEPEDDGTEYAEQYTTRERVKHIGIALGIVVPLVLAAELWAFPALRDFADRSYCYEWKGVNGTTLLMYGVFVGLPLGSALVMGVPAALFGARIIRDKQMPPHGQKVFKRTKIRRGRLAVAAGWAHMLPLVFFIGLARWGEIQADKLLADFDPAETDPHACAPNHELEPTSESAVAPSSAAQLSR